MDTEKNNSPTENTEEQLRIKSENQLVYKIAKKTINFMLALFKAGDSIKAIYMKK